MKRYRGKAFIQVICLLFYFQAFSQEGNPVIKNYFHTSDATDHLNISVRQDISGKMLFANSKGLMSFDGREWKLTATESTPIVIEPDKESGKVFAGFYKDFGYFIKDDRGQLNYYSTSPSIVTGETTRIILGKSHVYFFTEKIIYKVEKFTDLIESSWSAPENKIFTGIFLLKEKLYINIQDKGLHLVNGKNLTPLPSDNTFNQAEILFTLNYNESSVLIGSTLDELHLFNGAEIRKVNLQAEHYLKANFLTDGIDLGNDQIALSTLGGGFVISDKRSWNTLYQVNSLTGLPDNEIYAMGGDHNGGVWVCHHYGVSRFDSHLPFREYSNYPGLQGNLLSTLYFQQTLYVATTEGVFYLTKKENPINRVSSTTLNEEKKTDKKSIHHFLGQVFHKRKIRPTENTSIKKHKKPDRLKTATENKPIEFHYKKIEGISAKCRQLIAVKDYILVSSNKGLFEIRENKSREIIRDEYINHVFQTDENHFLVGLRHGLFSLSFQKGKSNIRKILNDHVQVFSITMDYNRNIWIGSNGKILKLKTDLNNNVLKKDEYHLPEFHNELILARSVHGIPAFFLSDGVYYYSSNENKILKDPNLIPGASYRFTSAQDEITWYRSEEGWIGLDKLKQENDLKVPYLSFFKNIRSIFLDDNQSIWILNGNNQLFRFGLKKEINSKIFDLHVQEIKSTQGNILPIKDLNLAHSENSLHFFLSAPYFFNEESVEYQYFIEGLMNGWSDWSKDNKIELTYLPVGEHTLHARARNGMGEFSDLEKISIAILPPYWKSGWFFIMEVFFFFSLIITSVVLNRSNHSRFFTKAITFLTLILVVEFIVYHLESYITMGNSENPIIRFGFNVMLALLISPVEKILEVAISKRRRKIAKLMLMWRRHF